ncbi:MAG TPA: hypothetical protein DCE43_00380 [Planctomycetaceae bacterium]|nr:hypothetical protein [Planctomycetaceae bacterium]
MIDIDAELLDLDAGWREGLETYRPADEPVAEESLAEEPVADPKENDSDQPSSIGLAELPAEEERDDWLPRVRSLDGFDDQRLSSLHGRLIALGWLGFEVGDRNTGMRYRLTREGQRVLDGLVPIPTLQVVTDEPQDELVPDRPVETTSESEDVVGELEPAEA